MAWGRRWKLRRNHDEVFMPSYNASMRLRTILFLVGGFIAGVAIAPACAQQIFPFALWTTLIGLAMAMLANLVDLLDSLDHRR
jgi:hypothetical protein